MHELAELEVFPLFSQQTLTFKQLTGGLNNSVFKIETGEKRSFVAKHFSDERACQLEANIQALAATYKLSPSVVYNDKHWLISKYINDKTLERSNLTIADKLTLAITLMVKFHQLPLTNLSDKHITTLSIYHCLTALAEQVTLADNIKRMVDSALLLAASLEKEPQQHVLVHGDLNFNNILLGDVAQLIDFEAASIAAASYDLGMLLAVNCIATEQTEFVVSKYNQLVINNEVTTLSVTRYSFFAAIINGLWYLSQSNLRNPELYSTLAQQQFDYATQVCDSCIS
ncbi:phosphotransferase [Colwellia sp. MEBiC06753]